MAGSDWDKQMAEIDRQLAALPDEALTARAPVAAPRPGPTPNAPAARPPMAPGAARIPRTWRITLALLLRVAIAAAALATVVLWPYPTTCGPTLAYYLAAVAAIGLAGAWTSVAAWKHRAPFIHVVGLGLVATSAVYAAREVLPRVGYAVPTATQSTQWLCP